jgi:hypothetical protein
MVEKKSTSDSITMSLITIAIGEWNKPGAGIQFCPNIQVMESDKAGSH